MRLPSAAIDGWALNDAEERHAQFPDTFWIPAAEARSGLHPGDYAKLMFRIEAPDGGGVERMWVIVTERRADGGYLGVLDNVPSSDEAAGRLELGFELPFESRHIIDVGEAREASMAIAKAEPVRRWR